MARLMGLALVFSCVVNVSLVMGQECLGLQGRWTDGPIQTVDAEGHIIVVGRGSGLAIINADDPAVLRQVGQLELDGVADDISFSGDLAFVAVDRQGLVVVDISEPAQPVEIGHFPTDSQAEGVVVTGSFGYLIDRWGGLWILDVSDPENPSQLGFLDATGVQEGLAVSGDLVLIAGGSAGLVLVDVSVPSEPIRLRTVDLPGSAKAVTCAGDIALVACYTGGLVAVNVEDPSHAYEISTWDEANYVSDVTRWGNFALVTCQYYGMYVVDYSVPVNITTVSQYLTAGGAMQVAEVGQVAYVADGDWGLVSVSLTNPNEPENLGRLLSAGSAYGVTAVGNIAYVCDAGGVIRVLDVSDPGSMEETGSVSLRTTVYDLVVDGTAGYAVIPAVGLATLDLTDPRMPVESARLSIDGQLNALTVDGGVAYLAVNDWQHDCGALHLVDVTDPAAPVELSVLSISSEAEDVVVSDGMAYVTTDGHGLRVVDISDPNNPVEFGSLEEIPELFGIDLSGTYVYVGADHAGLYVIDISDPSNPIDVARVETPAGVGDVCVDGNLVFVEQSASGALAVNVGDPETPFIVGSWEGIGAARQLSFSGGRLYVAESAAGVTVLDTVACLEDDPLVAAFEWEPVSPTVGDVVFFSDNSTGSPSSWTWNFGDGGTSQQQNPTHVFDIPGEMTVTLNVAADGETDMVSHVLSVRTATPPISDPGQYVYVVPAAASSPGVAETSWVTDLVLNVSGNDDATVDLFFMPSDRDNSSSVGHRVVVPANQSLKLEDIVRVLFGLTEVSGGILVGSDRELIVASRTFNNAESGTFGQFISGYPLEKAINGSEKAAIIQLTRNNDFRTNIGVLNVTGRQLGVTIDLSRSNGDALSTQEINVPPYGYVQENDILGRISSTNVGDGMAVVMSRDDAARYFCYASVVDNRSGDPVYISASTSAAEPFILPAAAHVFGAGNTNWRTDMEILKPGPVQGNITIELLRADMDNTSPESRRVSVPGGTSLRLRDVIGSVFETSGSAALRVTTGIGAIMVTSRTFNDLGDRTYGQYIPGLPDHEAIEYGEKVRLVLLSSSLDSAVGFRTNIGAVNVSAVPMRVRINLFKGDGESVGDLALDLEPYEYLQANDVYRAPGEDVRDGYAEVFTETESARFFVYASVVDNRSGDPIYLSPR